MPSADAPAQRTTRLSPEVIATRTLGRANRVLIDSMAAAWSALGGAPVWLLDATDSPSYAPDAIAAAGDHLVQMRARGLESLVVVTTSPMLRMGASIAAASTGVRVLLAKTASEAEAIVRGLVGQTRR